MSMTSLPLRVGADGRLQLTDTVDPLLRLFGIMAATGARHWPHAPWFGLAELFAGANLAREDQYQIADALTLALRRLGVDAVTVESVRTAAGLGPGERRFDITIATADGRFRHATLDA